MSLLEFRSLSSYKEARKRTPAPLDPGQTSLPGIPEKVTSKLIPGVGAKIWKQEEENLKVNPKWEAYWNQPTYTTEQFEDWLHSAPLDEDIMIAHV